MLLTETLKGDKLVFPTIPLFSEAGTLERLRLLGDRPEDTSIKKKRRGISLSAVPVHPVQPVTGASHQSLIKGSSSLVVTNCK